MPLSPHEENALARLEEGLRADDPGLAAVLAAPRSSMHPLSFGSSGPPLTARHVVPLVAALLGLVAAGTVLGDRPAALAGVTAALVLPWLVGTARSVARRPRGAGARTRRRRPGRPAWLGPVGWGTLALVGLVPVALAVTPSTGLAIVGLVLVLVVAPLVALRVLTWMDRRRR